MEGSVFDKFIQNIQGCQEGVDQQQYIREFLKDPGYLVITPEMVPRMDSHLNMLAFHIVLNAGVWEKQLVYDISVFTVKTYRMLLETPEFVKVKSPKSLLAKTKALKWEDFAFVTSGLLETYRKEKREKRRAKKLFHLFYFILNNKEFFSRHRSINILNIYRACIQVLRVNDIPKELRILTEALRDFMKKNPHLINKVSDLVNYKEFHMNSLAPRISPHIKEIIGRITLRDINHKKQV